MQYLLLIYENEAAGQQRSEAEQATYIADFRTFTADIIAGGSFKGGEALTPVSTAKSVRVRNGERLVTDGPFAETREQLGGFYLVDVDTEEEAVAIAARIPTSAYGTIEVRPIMVWDQPE